MIDLSALPGAHYLGEDRTRFRVWAPHSRKVDLHIVDPYDKVVPLQPGDRGWFGSIVGDTGPGTRYVYLLDETLERPDPASWFQPDGVSGASAVIDPSYDWTDDAWFGRPLADHVIYELHVGTFTTTGTFEAAIEHLDDLASLGVTALELMPLSQFPGERNWGYDGVFPYAPQHSYGGPDGLRRLVDACHRRGLAVILDVVYNHLGPEGAVHSDFGPYFTDRYTTPWGRAMNFDGPDSDEVRHHFIGNALYWFDIYHIDGLRLDACHAILDASAYPFLEELAAETAQLSERVNRRLHLIAESDDNDARLITPRELGGYGLDAQWNDDFHHSLYTLVTGERSGHYGDYGTLRHLAVAMSTGYVYQGEYSQFRRRRRGRSSRHRATQRFVVFTRNHDQIGNRMDGSRLPARVSFEELKLMAGALLLSPYIPLLFMGEEYAEDAPFTYFVSHADPDLVEAVRTGRRSDFAGFGWSGEPPDPADPATFEMSKIDRSKRHSGRHRVVHELYGELLRLRRDIPSIHRAGKDEMEVIVDERTRSLTLRRRVDTDETLTLFHLSETVDDVPLPVASGTWHVVIDSANQRWEGPGSTLGPTVDADAIPTVEMQPRSFVLLRTDRDDASPGS